MRIFPPHALLKRMHPFCPDPKPCAGVRRWRLVLGAWWILAAPLIATDFTWDGGGGDNNLATAANWVGDVAPTGVSTDNLIFTGAVRTSPNNNFAAATNFGSITFNAGGFTLGGNALVANGDIAGNAGTSTFSCALTLGAALSLSTVGGATLTITVTINTNTRQLTVASAGTVNLNGVVSGTGAVVKSGSGLLATSTAHTYSGGTTLSAGVLGIGVATTGAVTNGPVGTGTLTISGGTFRAIGATARTLANAVALTAPATFGDAVDTGALTFSGAKTCSGTAAITTPATFGGLTLSTATTTLNADLTITATTAVTISGGLTFAAAQAITLSGAAVTTLSGALSGGANTLTFLGTGPITWGVTTGASGGLICNGPTVTSSSASTFTGGVTVQSGALALGASTTGTVTNGPLGTGTLTVTGGTIRSINTTGRTLANALALNASATFGDATNNGLVTFSGTNTLSADVTLTQASSVTLSGGLTIAANRILTVAGAGTLTLAGALAAGANTLTFAGSSAVTWGLTTGTCGGLICNGPTVTSSSASTFTGGVTVQTGVLALGASTTGAVTDGPLGTGTLTVTGGTIRSINTTGRTLANALVLSASATFGDATNNGLVTFSGTNTLSADVTLTQASSVTLSGGLTIAANRVLTVAGAGTTTLAGALAAGANTLTFAGSSAVTWGVTTGVSGGLICNGPTVTSSSASTFSGGVTVQTGVLALGASTVGTVTSGPLGTGTLTVNGGTVRSTSGTARVLANALALNASTTFGDATNNGLLTFSGTNTLSADVTLTQASSVTLSGGLTIAANRILTVAGAGTTTLAGALAAGANTLTFAGSAAVTWGVTTGTCGGLICNGPTVTSSSASSFSGGVTVQSGILTLGAASTGTVTSGPLGTGTLTVTGGQVRTAGIARTLANTLALSASATFSDPTNSGILTFSGTTTFSGTPEIITVAGSPGLTLSGPVNLDANLTLSNATPLTLSGGLTFAANRSITVSGAGATTLSGALSGGASTLTYAGSAAATWGVTTGTCGGVICNGPTVTSSSASTFSGGVTLSSGILRVGVSTTGAVTNGPCGTGTLRLSGGTIGGADATARTLANTLLLDGAVTVGDATFTAVLTFSGAASLNQASTLTAVRDFVISGAIANAGGLLTVTGAANSTLSGIVSGGGGLTKAGGGTLTLSAVNTYVGATTVTGGTLVVDQSLSTASAVSVTAGATLAGIGSVGAVTVTAGTISPGVSGIGRLSVGSVSFDSAAATLAMTLAGDVPGAGFDQVVVAAGGTLVLGNCTLSAALAFTPSTGQVLTIIDNQTAAAVSGTFNGLAQGATATIGGRDFTVSYVGGDGNDVTLTVGAPAVANTTFTWNGGGADNNLSTAANWVGGVAPSGLASDDLVFTGPVRTSPNNDLAQVGALTFSAGGFTLAGAALTVNGDLSGNVGTSTVNCALTLGNGLAFAAATNATLVIGGTVANGGKVLAVAGAGTVTITGVVSGTGGMTKSQTGVLNLQGANTFSGGAALAAGLLSFNVSTTGAVTNGPVGTGTLTVFGGELTTNATRTIANAVAVRGDFSVVGINLLTLSGACTVVESHTITFTAGTTTFSGALSLNANLSVGGISNVVFSGTCLLAANRTLTVTDAITATWPGIVSGAFALTKAGSGILLASGASTYSGGLTLASGTLSLGVSSTGAVTNGPVGTGTLSLGVGTTIRASGGARTIANAVAVAGDFVNDSNQDLTLSGAVALTANATVAVSNSSTNGLTLSGVVGGVFSLTFGGTKLKLAGASTFSGGLTLASGTLSLDASSTGGPPPTSGPLGTGTFTLLGGTVQAVTSARTLGNALSLIGDFTVGGTIALTLSGAGELPVPVQITAANTTSDTTLSGALSGAGALIKAGAGTLVLSGANAWTGFTTVIAGTLRSAASDVLPATLVTVAGGILDLAGNNDAIGALTMTAGTVQTGVGTLTLGGTLSYTGTTTAATITGNLALGGNRTVSVADGAAASDLDVQAVVSGAASLTKTGAGTLVLSATNTWTGVTTISAGTVQLSGAIDVASAVTVAAAATLTGTGTAAGTVAIDGRAQPGVGAAGTLATGALTLSSTAVLEFELGDLAVPATSDRIASTGAVVVAGNCDVAALGEFGVGTYPLITCVGTPTGTLIVRTMPSGFFGSISLVAGRVDLVVTTVAAGGDFVWTGGGGDDNFSIAANWADGVAPTGSGGENLIFRGSKRLTPVNDLVGASIANVTFQAGGFSVGGNAVTVTGTLINSTGSNTIAAPLVTTTSRTISAAATTTLTMSGVISGAGGALLLNGAGTVVLAGVSTFDGGVTLAAGTLSLGSDSSGAVSDGPVGTGTLTITGGTLQATATRTIANAAAFTGDFAIAGSSALTLSGAITMAAARTLTLSNSAATTMAGTFAPGGDLTLAGAGTGTTTFSGPLTIAAARTITNNATAGSQVFGGTLAFDADLTVAGTRALTIGAGAITLSGNRTLTVSGPTLTVTGAIDGAFALTKAGSSQVSLNVASTFSGGLVLNAGTLAFGDDAAAGSGTLTINAGLIRANTVARTLANALTIAGSVTCDGTIDLILAGAATLTASPVITVTNTSANGLRFSGAIGGAFAVTKAGTGVLKYAGVNTYTGTTTVSAGTLRLLGDSGAIAGDLLIGADTTFDIDNTNVAANPDRIPNAATVTMNGGTWTLTAPTNIDRTENIGTLRIAADANQLTLTAAGTGNAQITAGAYSIGGGLNLTRTNATGTANLFIAAGFANGAPVPATTVGTLAAAYSTALGVIAGDPSSATTRTTAQSGNWDVGSTWVGGVAPVASDEAIVASDHLIDLNGADRVINSLTFSGGGSVVGANVLTITSGGLAVSGSGSPVVDCRLAVGAAPLAIGQGSSGTLTINGVVAGSAGLVKNGSGRATLTAANTFTGATAVQLGTLDLSGANAYAGGTSVSSGATLAVGDDQAIGSGTLTMRGGSLTVANAARTLTNAWAATAAFSTDGAFALTMSGTGTMTGLRIITVNNPQVTLSGDIGESEALSGLSKRGLGRLILSGQNTWTVGIIDWDNVVGIGSDTVLDGSGNIVSGPLGRSIVRFKGANNPGQTMEAIGGPRTLFNFLFTDGTTFFQGVHKITISETAPVVAIHGHTQIANNGGQSTFDVRDAATVVEFTALAQRFTTDNLTKRGPGTMIVRTSDHAGTTTVSGGTLLLVSDSTFTATSTVTVAEGATLAIDASGSANPDRLPDTCAVVLAGGTLSLSAPAGIDRTETVGSITVTAAGSQIILTPSGSGDAQLIAGNATGLARSGGDLRLTRGSSGGAGTANLFSPANGFGDGQSIPWASVNGSARAQYSAADGLIAANGTLFTTIANGNWNDNATWDLGSVPGASDEVSIGHNVSLAGADRFARRVAITAGITISASASEFLRILSGALGVSGSGSPTVSADLDLVTAGSIVHAGSGTLTLSGPLHGSSGLVKAGSGTAVLSAVNRFAGTLTVSAGRLEISGSSTHTGATTVHGAGTLAVSGGTAIPDGSTITLDTGARIEVAGGTETLNLVGWSDQAGSTISIASGGRLRLAGAASTTINGRLTGAGDVVVGAVVAANKPSLGNPANDLSGTIEVESGVLRYTQGAMPNAATVRVSARTVPGNNAHGIVDVNNKAETIGALIGDGFVGNNGATVVELAVGGDNRDGTFAPSAASPTGGVIGNNVAVSVNGPFLAVAKVGSGAQTLSGLSIYTGSTTVKAGTLIAGSAVAAGVAGPFGASNSALLVGDTLGSAPASLLIGGAFAIGRTVTVQSGSTGTATLGVSGAAAATWTGAVTLRRNVALSAPSGGTATFAAAIGGAFAVTKDGAGTVVLSAANTWSAGTTIAAGTLRLSGNAALADSGAVVLANVAGATLDLAGSSETIGSLAGGGATGGNVTLGAGTLTSGGNATSTTYAGSISGTGGLTKAGSGTLTLSGTNTCTGASTVSAGTLTVDGALSSTTVTAASGGTLAGTGTMNAVSVSAGGTLSPGTAGPTIVDVSQLSFTNATSALVVQINSAVAGTGFDQIAINGNGSLTLANATLSGSTGFVPTPGTTFTIIDLQGSGTISGTFNGIAEGGSVALGATAYTVSYVGGTGNDVVLTAGASTFIWDGGGVDNNWTTAANWVGDVAPAAGATLVFTGSTRLSNINDFTAGTAFVSITINANGFTLSGNALTLASGLSVTTGSSTVALNSTLTAAQTWSASSGATLTVSGTVTNGGFALTGTAGGTLTISGAISGSGGLVADGAGVFTLSGTNTFTGAATVNAGTLRLAGGTAIADSVAVTLANVAGVILDLNGTSETVGSLAGGGGTGGNVTLGAGTLTSGGDNTSTTFAGVASGTGGLTKAGTGVLTLSGTNAFTGAATVNAGTLRLAGGAAIADTVAVTLADVAGAILDLNGTSETVGSLAGGGVIGGNVTLGAGTLTSGGDNTSTTFAGLASGTGGLTKAGSGVLTLSGTNAFTGATTINAGTLSLTGSLDPGSAVSVAAVATLTGTGSAAGTLALSGTLAPGVAGAGTLTTGAVTMQSSTVLAWQLGDPAVAVASDHLAAGDLVTLAGNLDISTLSGFAAGTYTLITYTGATPANTCTLRTMPSGFAGSFDLSEAGKIKLVVIALVVRIEWDATARNSDGSTPAAASVATWDAGTLAVGGPAVDTVIGDPLLRLRNTGDLGVDLTIAGSVSGLTLTTGAPGIDQVRLGFSTTGAAPYAAIPAAPASAALAAGVAIGAAVTVDLEITPPTLLTVDPTPATATVQITATAQ